MNNKEKTAKAERKSARPVAKRPEGDSTAGEVALREEMVLEFWREHDIFKKTIQYPGGTIVNKPSSLSSAEASETGEGKDFVFYDGPPFATGLPHYGHILAGTIKDTVPRFWTMNGYRVRRKWGWDCHGLPLENLIEKKLGLATKRDIEEYGVKNFNEQARDTVMEFADDWRRIIPRMGRFVDMDDDYKTMDSSYTESVWWVFSQLHKKGLVYEGFKSMHLCPRCGTTLSNFEVNQGYKDIKDIAVTVKLPLLDEAGKVTDTSLLVWTTTPWTLPGNMAAAIHKEIVYAKVKIQSEVSGNEFLILAKERLTQLGEVEYEIVEEFKGADLVGKSYEPPFSYFKDKDIEGKANAWQIYHADYVELGEEGTGAVHLAPAYGEEDMELAKANGVPLVHHVDESGHFMEHVTDFAGQLVKPKDDDESGVGHMDADIEILKHLQAAGKIFKKENITHSYPHCWRCDTPLLNYATTSWFVEVTKIKDQLVSENQKVNWVPEHVGINRFGKWLEGARDWAVSRQRYWGAPLPIWRNPQTKDYKVFGSLAELQEFVPKSGNTYLLMRHGESESNAKNIVSTELSEANPLTETGKTQVATAIEELKSKGVTKIIHSPFERTTATAQMVAEALDLPSESVTVDGRIGEIQLGEFNGQDNRVYHEFLEKGGNWCDCAPIDGESWLDVKRRVGEFIYEIEATQKEETILIISHNSPLRVLGTVHDGRPLKETDYDHDAEGMRYSNAEVRELSFTPMPHNDEYALDFHRPYIDEIELFEEGVKLERVLDVFDCWFESGSMPYAETHYPFDPNSRAEKDSPHYGERNLDSDGNYPVRYPADFISEAVDQTRGWFYSLTVLGVALFGKSPFENVITNGLVLAEDGKKMSKKLQNYPDPIELVNRQGADAMRFYLLSSSIIKGEDLNFSEKEVQELQRKNIGRLHNVLQMYETYADSSQKSKVKSQKSEHVLDSWIIARLNEITEEITAGYKNYELDKATRPVTDFIDDLSVWYLRRSRDRLKSADEADKQLALCTLNHVLKTLALLMAPSMPFYADYLWGRIKNEDDVESVHLAAWPTTLSSASASETEAGKADYSEILEQMVRVREVVSLALEKRVQAKLKVRQPLALLKVKMKNEKGKMDEELVELIKDEINVKEVIFDSSIENEVELDTNITPELKAEGDAREFMRQIQEQRKQMGLEPNDRIILTVQTSDGGEAIVNQFRDDIQNTVGASEINFANADLPAPSEARQAGGAEIVAGEHSFTIEITKVD